MLYNKNKLFWSKKNGKHILFELYFQPIRSWHYARSEEEM